MGYQRGGAGKSKSRKAENKNAKEIGALFTDYDGTIAPSDVCREESRVPEPLHSKLVELSSRVPIAVITSKDYDFIKPRTSAFAKAWACVSGLDIRFVGEERTKKELFGAGGVPDIEPSLRSVEASLPPGLIVERKRASDNRDVLLGFSIDWRTGPKLTDSEVERITERLECDGLYVSHSPWQTYLDAFAAKPSKGRALSVLTKRLDVSGNVVYLGDSDADNDAFDLSDTSIGIDHGQPTDTLHCRYVVPFGNLATFLGRY